MWIEKSNNNIGKIYGSVGYTVLKNPITNNRVLIFADKHDELKKCNDSIQTTHIADWLKEKIHSSKILLEEVPRDSVELEELWSESNHTQELKKLYLSNPKQINGVDIRLSLIPFSWELISELEAKHHITVKKYIETINDFFCVKYSYIMKKLQNYKIDKLKETKLGKHFLMLKIKFKKLLEDYKAFIHLSIITVKLIKIDLLLKINDLLDDIMEWYICANIKLYNSEYSYPVIVHAGLSHSEKIISWLLTHYEYKYVIEYGKNKMSELLNSNDDISGCSDIDIELTNQFGGKQSVYQIHPTHPTHYNTNQIKAKQSISLNQINKPKSK